MVIRRICAAAVPLLGVRPVCANEGKRTGFLRLAPPIVPGNQVAGPEQVFWVGGGGWQGAGRLKDAVLRAVLRFVNLDCLRLTYKSDDGRTEYDLPVRVLLADADVGNNTLLLDELAEAARTINPQISERHLKYFADPERSYPAFRWRVWNAFTALSVNDVPQFRRVPGEYYDTTNLATVYSPNSLTNEIFLKSAMPHGVRMVGIPDFGPECSSLDGFQSKRVVFIEDGVIYFGEEERAVPIHGWMGAVANPGFQLASDFLGFPVQAAYPFQRQSRSKQWFYPFLGAAFIPVPYTRRFSSMADVERYDFESIRGRKIILKPDEGYGGYGVAISFLADPTEMRQLVGEYLRRNNPVLLQEFTRPPERYTWRDERGREIGWVAEVFVVQPDIDGGPVVPEISFYHGPMDKPINAYHGAVHVTAEELFEKLKLPQPERKRMLDELRYVAQRTMDVTRAGYLAQTVLSGVISEKDLPRLLRLDLAFDGEKFVVLEVNSGTLGAITENGGAAKAWIEMMARDAMMYKRSMGGRGSICLGFSSREINMLSEDKAFVELMKRVIDGGLEGALNEMGEGNPIPIYMVLTALFLKWGQIETAELFAKQILTWSEEDPEDRTSCLKMLYALYTTTIGVPNDLRDAYARKLDRLADSMDDYLILAGYNFIRGEHAEACRYFRMAREQNPELEELRELEVEYALKAGEIDRLSKVKMKKHEEAQLAILRGDIERAKAIYQELFDTHETMKEYDALLYALLLAQEDPEKARRLLQMHLTSRFNYPVHVHSSGRLFAAVAT